MFKNKINKWGKIFFFVISMAISWQAYGVEPYDNIVVPDGSYFLMYPAYFSADKLRDSNGSIVNRNLNLRARSNVFRYSYAGTFKKSNRKWLATVLLPVVNIQVSNEQDQGIGDMTVGGAYWLINKPASNTWLVVAGFVDIPTGRYNPNNSVNVGSNIWKFRPTFGYAKQINKFEIEFAYRYNIFSRNNSNRLKKGNENIFESYLGYSISPSLMLGIHANYIDGQNHESGGLIIANSAIRKRQIGSSINWNYAKKSGITFIWLSDQKNENTPEGNSLIMRLSWRL